MAGADPLARAAHAVATVTGASPDAAAPARVPVAARVAALQAPVTVARAEPRVTGVAARRATGVVARPATGVAARPATGVAERAVAAQAVSATPDRQGPSTTASDGAAAGSRRSHPAFRTPASPRV